MQSIIRVAYGGHVQRLALWRRNLYGGARLLRRMRVPLLLLAVLLVSLPMASAQPRGVHLAFGSDATQEMRVAFAGPPATDAAVEWGTTDALGNVTSASAKPMGGHELVSYTAVLSGLAANTTYHYRARLGGERSEAFEFRTAPIGRADFRVLHWGDHGVPDAENPLGEADGDAPVRNVGLARTLMPAMHVVAGDLSYANGVPTTWDKYFDMLEPYAARTPYMAAVGNHEREAGQGFTQYDARLPVPNHPTGRWYAVRYANAVFIALDTEHACAEVVTRDFVPGLLTQSCNGGPQPDQYRFLEDTLKAARADAGVDWIVTYHHYPLWSDGRHGSNLAIRNTWGPLYDKYGVDLVLQGHDHVYERTKPIRGTNVTQVGTVYITGGTGGASHYAFKNADPPEWVAGRNNAEYGVVVLDFSGINLTGRFVSLSSTTLDTFELQHVDGGVKIRPHSEEAPAAPTPPSASTPALAPMAVALALMAVALRRGRHGA
jgi:3',5'-cyclic AMP phosphodiesterase CpdA